jgi:hypothetical protein
MNHPKILGVRTANPPVSLTQEQSFRAAGYQGERIRKIFLNGDIGSPLTIIFAPSQVDREYFATIFSFRQWRGCNVAVFLTGAAILSYSNI